MKDSELLTAVKAKIEEGWCKGAPAKDKQGNAVAENDPNACQWCISGAIHLVANEPVGTVKHWNDCSTSNRIMQRLRSFCHSTVVDWNDDKETSKEDVLAMLNRAIEAAEKDGQ